MVQQALLKQPRDGSKRPSTCAAQQLQQNVGSKYQVRETWGSTSNSKNVGRICSGGALARRGNTHALAHTYATTHWLTQLLTISLIYSLVNSITHLLAYSPTPWLTQFLTSSLNYSLDYPRTGLITHPVACFLAFACYLIINFYMTGNERVR